MLRCAYKAEILKNSHTASEKAAVLMPVLDAAFSAFLAKEYFMVDLFNWWYMVLLPGMLAVICGGVCKREQWSENRNILVLPVDVKVIWDAKILCVVRLFVFSGIFMTGIAVITRKLLEYGLHVEYVLDIDYKRMAAAMVILLVTFLWQIPFCMLLEQFIGMPLMLIVYMLIYGVSACSLSLKPYFMMFPGAVPARLMCAVLQILPNGMPAKEGAATFSPELLDDRMIGIGVFCALLWFFLLWMLTRRIYERRVLGR